MNAVSEPAVQAGLAVRIRGEIEQSIATKQLLLKDAVLLAQVEKLVTVCLTSLRAGGKIIFAGNGGSFADAQHLSAEFTCRFMLDRAPLASIALGTNSSAISAIGNDYGYEHVFSRELEALARPEDVFIPISTSGNSANVLTAVEVARRVRLSTVGFTGQSGGRMKAMCDCICIPATETARIQECHILIGHIVCGQVEAEYFREVRK